MTSPSQPPNRPSPYRVQQIRWELRSCANWLRTTPPDKATPADFQDVADTIAKFMEAVDGLAAPSTPSEELT